MRVTRKMLEETLEEFCALLGKRPAVFHGDIGAITLDRNGEPLRVFLHQITNEGGGVRSFGPQECYTNKELWEKMRFTISVLRHVQWEEDMARDRELNG